MSAAPAIDRLRPSLNYLKPGDVSRIEQAFQFSDVAHHGQMRQSGDPYISHPVVVAEIVAKFIQHFDAKRERCWIAEKDGENVGSVFLVKKSKAVAKLRLLLVEPKARGLGIGARLIAECIRFARQTGYRKVTLWTQSELAAARHLYQEAGFALVHKHRHRDFGRDSVAETWELKL